jgi:hypothetical protein
MFLSSDVAYLDPDIRSDDPLVTAIVSVCDDLVHRIGVHEQTGTLVYVRHNIEKDSYHGDPKDHPMARYTLRKTSSLWSLLNSSLTFLHRPHPDSALVTAWAGRMDGGNVVAFPLGFVPGARADLLAQAAEHPALVAADWLHAEESKNKSLKLTAILPGKRSEYSESICEFENVLAKASEAVPGASSGPKYHGPFTLDFDYGRHGRVTIQKTETHEEVARILRSDPAQEPAYTLLVALALVPVIDDDRRVSHNAYVGQKSTNAAKKSSDRGGKARSALRDCGLDPAEIFDIVHGYGWRLMTNVTVRRCPNEHEKSHGVGNPTMDSAVPAQEMSFVDAEESSDEGVSFPAERTNLSRDEKNVADLLQRHRTKKGPELTAAIGRFCTSNNISRQRFRELADSARRKIDATRTRAEDE